ncbi:MAG TPA: DUF2231 domain-containing protein [Candidatus Acidoferrum sp.]|nr:DUF2231 domain-containing protein [Candidatus Acidoferrum sp.]
MLNPFDLKAALAARHGQHVVLIHFPIALFIAGAAFDFVAHWMKRQSLAAAAYFNFLVAAAASIPAMISGLLAWQWQLEGQRLKGTLLLHLIFGVTSGALVCVVWLIHWSARRARDEKLRLFCLPLEALTAVLLAVTGHLGGFLSGVNGPG